MGIQNFAKQPVHPAHSRYGTGAIAFHWLVALLIVFLGVLGLLLEDFPRETQPFRINVHGVVGLLYFALVIAPWQRWDGR